VLTVTEEQVRALLPMADCVERLRECFRDLAAGTAQNQVRRRLRLPSGAMLHSLAGAWGGYFGTKVYSTHPKHGAHFTLLLYDAATAEPLAQFEANWLGQIRTGAASGLATDLLARENARTLLLIGGGFQAEGQLAAVRAVRPLQRVLVWGRYRDRASTFAQRHGAEVADSLEVALAQADIVVTATSAKDPVFAAGSVRPGTHINAVGSNHPQRRELPAELVQSATIVVDSLEAARTEAGDLLLAWGNGEWPESVRELQSFPRRASAAEVTVFKSVGLGVEDVAAAALVYERLR
jgi:ornithine cyclodeaminase/alanine dehydrogenase-like protein (mu-crystallin family)